MRIATDILIYAWVGWSVFMVPTLCILALTSWALLKVSNRIWKRLTDIYRGECIRYYFDKMEKEGTHAFKNTNKQEIGDKNGTND